MNKTLKSCLVLLLISSLALLPLRAAFAMPMNMSMNVSMDTTGTETSAPSSDHCKEMASMDMSTDEDSSTPMNNNNCCDQCDNDCNHCMSSTVSMLEMHNLQTTNHQAINFTQYSYTSFITRELSPPFRPPLAV